MAELGSVPLRDRSGASATEVERWGLEPARPECAEWSAGGTGLVLRAPDHDALFCVLRLEAGWERCFELAADVRCTASGEGTDAD